MFKILVLWMIATASIFVFPPCVFASKEQMQKPEKAILLVAFGTSVPEAQKAFDHIEDQVRNKYKNAEIRWAYTSKIIRAKLLKQGKSVDSPEVALAKIMDEGFKDVSVVSLHIFPGQEFHDLYRNIQLFGQMSGGFSRVELAPPLLSSHDDMVRTAGLILKRVPQARENGEAVIFMGHGNDRHPADAMYIAMNYILQGLDVNAYMATVQGHPTLEEILPKIKEKGVKKAYLIPFMAVAGEHARRDMAGDDPESWKSILIRNGIACEPILNGIAEYPEIVDLWLERLEKHCNAK